MTTAEENTLVVPAYCALPVTQTVASYTPMSSGSDGEYTTDHGRSGGVTVKVLVCTAPS